MPATEAPCQLTFHHVLLDNFTELFHVRLRQVFAVLGCLQPLVRTSIALEFRWARLGDLAVDHVEPEQDKRKKWRCYTGDKGRTADARRSLCSQSLDAATVRKDMGFPAGAVSLDKRSRVGPPWQYSHPPLWSSLCTISYSHDSLTLYTILVSWVCKHHDAKPRCQITRRRPADFSGCHPEECSNSAQKSAQTSSPAPETPRETTATRPDADRVRDRPWPRVENRSREGRLAPVQTRQSLQRVSDDPPWLSTL